MISVFAWGCEKEPGTGGSAEIHGHVHYEANDEVIPNATVQLWYGETSISGDPDDSQTANDDGEFDFDDLLKGDYYLYATGLDATGAVREGGLAVNIDQKSGAVDADIDVE